MEYGANYLHSKADELSALYREIKPKVGRMINLCHQIEDKAYAPDLEQVRKEAYDEGFKNAVHNCPEGCPYVEQARKEAYDKGYADAKSGYENGYENGMIVAWEAARKIWKYDTTTLKAIFGEGIMRMDWFMKFTASEAIEKLNAFEQEQKELGIQKYFKNGEEVIDADCTKAVILRVSEDNYCQVYTEKDCIENWHIHTYKFHKTGRYFPEIATVLEKMRGE